jgi:CDP-diacylglycerol--glycerol-3-phosphate 3-phosphatidyltransferase
MTLKSIPNILTAIRIALSVAVFFALATAAFHGHDEAAPGAVSPLVLFAFFAFVICALTDFFDGWLARKLDAQSAWGAILDPIGDKIAVLAAIFGLILLEPRFGIAVPGFLILFREMFVSGLREAGAGRGLKFPVTQLAKWKTTVQLVALSLEILAASAHLSGLVVFSDVLLWVAALMTLWTGGQYMLAAARQL